MPANIAKDRFGYLSVYADEKPWHPEVGVIVKGAQTAEQVIRASRQNGGEGLGFIVETVPAYAKIGGRFVEAPDMRAIVRKGKDQAVFGFGTADYKPIQIIDVLRLPEAIVKTKQAGWISAFALGNGAKYGATLDLSRLSDVKIPGDPSRHKAFMTVTGSHDGTEAVRVGFGSRRIECANMRKMQIAEWDSGRVLSARIVHAGDIKAQTEEAARILGFAQEAIQSYTKLMAQLAEISVSQKWLEHDFLPLLVPIPDDMTRTHDREQVRESIAHLYKTSKTLTGVKATAYRALQAVDEYADHYRPMRTNDRALAAQRQMRTILGEGPAADLKARALELMRQEFEIGVKVPVLAKSASVN